MIDPAAIDFEKGNGLVPVVVQDAATLQVLTLAYMDRAALDETIASSEATFLIFPSMSKIPPKLVATVS